MRGNGPPGCVVPLIVIGRVTLRLEVSMIGPYGAMAERQIRRDLVIETIAEREGLAATEKDLDDRIAEQAEKRGANPGQVYAQLEKSGRLKEMERSITEDKVFRWLLERNDVLTNA